MRTARSATGRVTTGVVVLLYHRLVEDRRYPSIPPPESIFSIPEGRFREQIHFLATAGYRALSLEEFESVVAGRTPTPARAVLITFDDGCESVCRLAAPILAQHRMPGVVFVTADETARIFSQPHSQRRLTQEEVRALVSQGVRCESHGLSHLGLSDLGEADLIREMTESRRRIAELAGREVISLALPLNAYDRRVLAAARTAGYRMIFTANPGLNRGGDDPFRLRRILVEGGSPLNEFRRALTPAGLRQRRIVAWLKRLPPRLISYRRWMPLRRRLFSSPLGCLFTPAGLRRLLFVLAALAALGLVGGLAAALLRGPGPQ